MPSTVGRGEEGRGGEGRGGEGRGGEGSIVVRQVHQNRSNCPISQEVGLHK